MGARKTRGQGRGSGISKPMVWVRVAFHGNDGNHENDENDEDNSDSYKQGVERWICRNQGNHENYENHGDPGCKSRVSQTTGLEIPEWYSHWQVFPRAKGIDAPVVNLGWGRGLEVGGERGAWFSLWPQGSWDSRVPRGGGGLGHSCVHRRAALPWNWMAP